MLDLGLQHHSLALEQMRTMTCRQRESDIQPLLACALMLVPFALAFQHIQHWVLFAKGMLQDTDVVSPRDAILLLRGIGTTIGALNSNQAENGSSKSQTPWDAMFSTSQSTNSKDLETIPERSHSMYPILAATFHQALLQLQFRIENALASPQEDENTVSAFDAYDILNDIMSSTFSDCATMKNSSEHTTYSPVAPDSLLSQAPGWLRNFVLRRPQATHTDPLVRTFLAFFRRVSKAYVDLLLPLLEPRTDGDNVDDEHELTTAEVLALDVYAHWLVLMLLVEEEAWWVGNFPFVALQGLVARYGDGLLGTSSARQQQQQQWWPESMLEVATRLRHWK
ncbi:hypothetical protein LTR43_010192 [Exophiala xenobiotica]|nr:hypothetical protein LTR14_009020 [Exophiala xenobiotica]KAK5474688.1 hypothetical protein LTR55_009616 [Exophiala xenobiotica]